MGISLQGQHTQLRVVQNSVGTDPRNFVTKKMPPPLDRMGANLVMLLKDNIKLPNLSTVDLTYGFNHCTMISYYADPKLKYTSSLGFHAYCDHSVHTSKFVENKNTQKKNTPAAVFSVGDSRDLHWKKRKMDKLNGRGCYV